LATPSHNPRFWLQAIVLVFTGAAGAGILAAVIVVALLLNRPEPPPGQTPPAPPAPQQSQPQPPVPQPQPQPQPQPPPTSPVAPAPPAAPREPAAVPPVVAPLLPPDDFEPKAPPEHKLIGFAMTAYDHPDPQVFFDGIDELHELGFNAFELVVPVFAGNARSRGVQIGVGPGRSVSPIQIVAILQHARSRGMYTTLMPIVVLTQPRGSEWRGVLEPPDWDAWWLSYRQMIDRMIDLGKQAEVDAICVGSELLSTEHQTQRWVDLIAHCRTRFQGHLIYSANWDHYDVPKFWSHLDMVGINGYFDLTTPLNDSAEVENEQAAIEDADPHDPDVAQLAKRWKHWRDELLAFARKQQRPLILTEVGYPSTTWALQNPWKNDVQPGDWPDFDAQAKGYAAFLKAWGPLLKSPEEEDAPADGETQFVGVHFFQWDVRRHGSATDTSYGIRGKPALDLLYQWLHGKPLPRPEPDDPD